MNLLSMLQTAANPAPLVKGKHKRDTTQLKVRRTIVHEEAIAKYKELTGKSFTSDVFRGIVSSATNASRICRRLIQTGYVVEDGHVQKQAGHKPFKRYVWIK